MKQPESPIAKDLVLIGGGHSHAIVLRMIGMKPIESVRVTLISDVTHTPYSGMLPGYISGLYSYEESHIDLRKLANFAGAQFVKAKVIKFDPDKQEVYFADRPSLSYDVASINTGSVPEMESVDGAHEYAVPAKPTPVFIKAWKNILELSKNSTDQLRLAVVGGGAGGVEISLSMQKRLFPQSFQEDQRIFS